MQRDRDLFDDETEEELERWAEEQWLESQLKKEEEEERKRRREEAPF